MPTAKRCRDCPPGTRRKASYPGPRCYTHHKEVTQDRRQAARGRYIEDTYNITEEQYQALYAAQGGKCAICQRAKGTGRRRLAVDHDHACCNGPKSCGKCVRGLLCKPCNRNVLGHLRDDIRALQRAIEYLAVPPARSLFGSNT